MVSATKIITWIVLMILVVECVPVTSFLPPSNTFSSTRCSRHPPSLPQSASHSPTRLSAEWQESLREIFGMGEKEVAPNDNDNDDGSDGSNSKAGVVARLAVRQFDPDSSKPSSRSYTTRKVELTAEAHVTKEGVQGDYNHYRSVALKSTQDRAISLQTNDVLAALRSEYPKYDIRDGDLGENVSVDNVPFDFFQVGKRYKFVDEENEISTSSSSSSSVIVEITEKMDPCANLCKLSYINDDSVEPKQRIARCQDFLQFLDRYDGYRGWYAKVIQEGFIQKGSKIVLLD